MSDFLTKHFSDNLEQKWTLGLFHKIQLWSARGRVFESRSGSNRENYLNYLKTHTKRKHADNQYSKSCEFCWKTLDKSVDMKNQMHSHTTKTDFKLKCEYVGNSRVALDVHIGNCHSDKNKCGLWENFFENNQELNIHL